MLMGEKMVDKVTRLMKAQDTIRNIAICAHIDHGKTTFSDNLLFGAGMMSGALAGEACVLDFHEDEKQRGITIDAANVNMVHEYEGKEFLINLIDTPGHVDFGGDVTRAMRAVDGCIVLACAVEGVMPQTETVLKQALRERVRPILFINKVDRLIKELRLTSDKIQERFVKIITHVNKLIRELAPPEYKEAWQVAVQNGSVCFGSARSKWAMSIAYMQKKNISFKDIIDAFEKGDESAKELENKAPLHQVILDAVIKHLPNPVTAQAYRIPKIWHGDIESEDGRSLIKCDKNGPLFFVITKIVVDPQAGEISAGRLFSGTMKRGVEVYLNRSKQRTRIQQVFIYNGAKREIVDDVPAGNIIGIAGVKSRPGETITINPSEPFEEITHLFEPVVTKSVEAKRPADLPKLIDVLRMVQKEDPSIKIEINEETGEHLMSGMGELHLEVIENRIKTEKGVEITTSPPIVVFRETITKKTPQEVEGKSPNKHNKLYFIVEPLEPQISAMIKSEDIPAGRVKKKNIEFRDKFVQCGWDTKIADKVKEVYQGSVFVDETRGEVYMIEVIELILDMFEDVMRQGPLAREPCTGIKVRLVDVKLHEDSIHRGPAQMYPAVREGIRDAMRFSGPVLFEPVQTLMFEAPVEFMGEITKLIANKRGQMLDMNHEENRVQIKGKLPVAAMFGLASELRSVTEGRGNYSLIDQTFERMPMELQDKTVKQIRERKGLTENQ